MSDFIVDFLVWGAEVFSVPRNLAQSYRDRVTQLLPSQYWDILKSVKGKAVAVGDQAMAKAAWCFEAIGRIQDHFIEAFSLMKNDQFYRAWCNLERCEIEIGFLDPHFQDSGNQFGIEHIRNHVPKFQALFPYKLFLSPAFIVRESRCSICKQPFRLRKGCEHKVGEIYNGEMCFREITKANLLEVSLVENPVQKYSVPFGPDIKYNYGAVKYVIQGLRSPWQKWDYRRYEVPLEKEPFPGTERNEPCPCGSKQKYKECCLKKVKFRVHFEVYFEEPPPDDLPSFIEDVKCFVDEKLTKEDDQDP